MASDSGIQDAPRAADESAALAVAREFGHAVAVDSETTPTSQVAVLPDGSKQLENDSLPVRVSSGGSWVPVDTTLVEDSDGMVAPKKTAAPVEFSGGGSNVLAKVRTSSGSWVSETWPGDLPAPTLSDESATYSDVLPGVDLRLTATAGGMDEVLIVSDAQAAANPALAAVQLGVTGATVSATAQSVTASASDGSQLAASQPIWWDSSADGASSTGPGGDSAPRPLDHSTTTSSIALDVASATATPSVQYPIYVDPDWSSGVQSYWFTDAAYPTQSYLNGQSADGIQSVGNGGGYLSRAFWQFGTSPLNGAHVIAAQFSVTEVWSNTCVGKDIQAWRYGNATPGFTWNTDPGMWNTLQDTKNLSAGSSCSGAAAVGFNVLNAATWAAAGSVGTLQIGLRAVNDTTDTLTRRHFSQAASLTVTYNSPPRIPADPKLTSPVRACINMPSASPAYIGTSQDVTFQVAQTDPDPGDLINNAFYVYNSAGTQVWSAGAAPHAQGYSSVTMPKATVQSLGDGTYHWVSRAGDGIDLSSAYSTPCYFAIKSSRPSLPTIDPGSGPFTVGHSVQVNITSQTTDQVAGYLLWWRPTLITGTEAPPQIGSPPDCSSYSAAPVPEAGYAQYVCATPNSLTTTVSVAPINTAETLWVQSFDKAGNPSQSSDPQHPEIVDVGKEIPATVDSNVTGGEHSWDLSQAPLTSIPDSHSSPGDLPVTVGTSTWDTSDPFNVSLNFTGFTVLDRFAGTTHSSGINGNMPAGDHLEGEEGGMFPLFQSQPANTYPIYLCALSVGTITATRSTCDGTGVTGTLIGYSGQDASVYAGFPGTPIQLHRCHTAVDYFDSASPTCEGATTVANLGWFLPVTATKSASTAVDTAHSFTVTATLKPTPGQAASTSSQPVVAVSEAGPTNSSLYIESVYDGSVRRYNFCVQSQVNPALVKCVAGPSLDPNTFTKVSGIFDPGNNQIRIVTAGPIGVNTAPYTSPANETSAPGALLIGANTRNGSRSQAWDGWISGVAVYPGVVDIDALEQ